MRLGLGQAAIKDHDKFITAPAADRIRGPGSRAQFGTWAGSAVFRPDSTPARLKRMAKAGCNRLDIGLESASPKILRSMKKGYIVEHAEQMLRGCHEAGIEVNLNVIVGFPGETDAYFQLTLDFLRRNHLYISGIGPPNELWVGNDNQIARSPERFGIKVAERGEMWESVDGTLNHDIRQARAAELKRLVAEMRIGIAAGNDDQKQLHEAAA